MKLTKTDKARVVIQAIFNLAELPPIEHPRVIKLARCSTGYIDQRYANAHAILSDKAQHASDCTYRSAGWIALGACNCGIMERANIKSP